MGMIWPTIVQRFQVNPDEPDKESSYIAKNIDATRKAFGIEDVKPTSYNAQATVGGNQLNQDAASLPGVRLLDPSIVSSTFDQLQQLRGYYSVPGVLDVDRYEVDGQERDLVVAARELHLEGLPEGQKNWANQHTVYTHGYGLIAAYGNQRDADDRPVTANQGLPVWAEEDLPPKGVLTGPEGDGYRPQIYFGENSPTYSIVGKKDGGKDVELDLPQGSNGESGSSTNSTYSGKDGVKIGSLFNKLLYAVKFSEPKLVLSSRVNENSKILYDRRPAKRVEKVAPWLTVDSDALPAVVDGKIVWILDGYTTTNRYPNAEKRSLREMVSDSINPRSPFATLPTDQINYMRNAVKATVDAYDGTVTLYAWDEKDPILKAWQGVFPDVVQPKDDIPDELLEHFRYPVDLYKVQRNILAEYHVTDAKTFYEGNDRWEVPQDPNKSEQTQPPYRLSVSTKSGEDPVFSLTSVYVPTNKQNLAAFMTVGADAADAETYGKFQILRLPDNNQVSGPSQISSRFISDDDVARIVRDFRNSDASAVYGNLLTLPVGGGLLYVQPLYTIRQSGTGNYPTLQRVLVSFGTEVGIGSTLTAALEDVLEKSGSENPDVEEPGGGDPGTDPGTDPGGSPGDGLSLQALRLLAQADQAFRDADAALADKDLARYAELIEKGRGLVQQALALGRRDAAAGPSAGPTPTS
jgi:uncharacterized membrane protein (UPF0182 family)